LKQIHLFYFFRRTPEGVEPMIVQIIVEHDDAGFDGTRAARELACADNDQTYDEMRPLLVVDVPEIRLVLHRGDVQAVYGKVSVTHPAVTVYDLDTCQDEEAAAERIRATLDASGFRMIPFSRGDCGTPQPK
jgi:hypothetical protein